MLGTVHILYLKYISFKEKLCAYLSWECCTFSVNSCMANTLSPMFGSHRSRACINMHVAVLRNREGHDPYFH